MHCRKDNEHYWSENCYSVAELKQENHISHRILHLQIFHDYNYNISLSILLSLTISIFLEYYFILTFCNIKIKLLNNVKLCKKTGGSITDVVEQVAEDYGFSEEKASAYVEKYW